MTDEMRLSRVRQLWHGRSTDWSQEELVWWLRITQGGSWDIPSALAFVCPHTDDEVPMHHRASAREIASYPALEKLFTYTNNSWDYLDGHFAQDHGLDLTDERINWSFDT